MHEEVLGLISWKIAEFTGCFVNGPRGTSLVDQRGSPRPADAPPSLRKPSAPRRQRHFFPRTRGGESHSVFRGVRPRSQGVAPSFMSYRRHCYPCSWVESDQEARQPSGSFALNTQRIPSRQLRRFPALRLNAPGSVTCFVTR